MQYIPDKNENTNINIFPSYKSELHHLFTAKLKPPL